MNGARQFVFCLVVHVHSYAMSALGEVQGIEVVQVRAGAPEGHCGFPRMGCEATRSGNLAIFSELGAATEVELTIPARAAYRERRRSGRFRSGRKARTMQEHAKESRY